MECVQLVLFIWIAMVLMLALFEAVKSGDRINIYSIITAILATAGWAQSYYT